VIVVSGTEATARLHYTQDRLEVDGVARTFGRTTPLQDLLAHRDAPAALQSPLAGCGGFMTVLEALRSAPAPRPIPAGRVLLSGSPDDPSRVVPGLAAAVRCAAESGAGFAEAGRPW